MIPTMADETREVLLNRVKEQGEIVRQLKAAKADTTQVYDITIFSPLLQNILIFRLVTDVYACPFFLCLRELLSVN